MWIAIMTPIESRVKSSIYDHWCRCFSFMTNCEDVANIKWHQWAWPLTKIGAVMRIFCFSRCPSWFRMLLFSTSNVIAPLLFSLEEDTRSNNNANFCRRPFKEVDKMPCVSVQRTFDETCPHDLHWSHMLSEPCFWSFCFSTEIIPDMQICEVNKTGSCVRMPRVGNNIKALAQESESKETIQQILGSFYHEFS